MLDFLGGHAYSAQHGTDEEWRVWDSTAHKFFTIDMEHMVKEEEQVSGPPALPALPCMVPQLFVYVRVFQPGICCAAVHMRCCAYGLFACRQGCA